MAEPQRALVLAPFSAPQIERMRAMLPVVYEPWLETRRLWDPAELGARLNEEDVGYLVIEADFAFEELFEAAAGLRLVGVCRNALNHVDIDAATAHGVAVTHAPGRNTNAVAEMTLGLMLALARRIVPAHLLVSGAGWRDPSAGYRLFRGREIAASTVGIVGCGQIGREVARKAVALGARVVAHDPFVPPSHIVSLGAEPATLDALLAASDYVSLHVPESPDTHHLVDAAFLARMRPGAYLVNTSSGAAVDPAALTDALERRHLAGAALDVFEGQPLPHSDALMSAPNLLLTPHVGGATEETIERHARMMVDEIGRMLAGEPLAHCVNPGYAAARMQ